MLDIVRIPGTEVPHWAESLFQDRRPFITDDLLSDEYHGSRALVSKSMLDLADQSGRKFRYRIDHPELDKDDDETPEALVVGNAFHCFVLEPLSFSRRYIVMPDFGDMRSSKNRDFRDGWKRDHNPGDRLQVLTKDQHTTLKGMRESVFGHKRMRQMLEDGRPEVTAAWIDPETGLPCKVRTDWLSENLYMGFDLKSARNASKRFWRFESIKRRYEVQDAFYCRGFQENNIDLGEFWFGVVEKEPPYDIGLYLLPDTRRAAGEEAYMNNLRSIRKWVADDYYPTYCENVEVLE